MKKYKAILFELNGTVVNIWTDEGQEALYRTMSNLLGAYGMVMTATQFHDRFFDIMKEQRQHSVYEHPEFNAVGIFKAIIDRYSTQYTQALPLGTRQMLPSFFAQAYRCASIQRLETYPGALQVLEQLKQSYALAAVSDGQSIWEKAEMLRLGLDPYFQLCLISSDFGFRKPTPQFFQAALKMLGIAPQEAIYVGNDMYRDVYGSKMVGMTSIYFKSNQGDQSDHGVAPDYVIYDFEKLPEAVQYLENK